MSARKHSNMPHGVCASRPMANGRRGYTAALSVQGKTIYLGTYTSASAAGEIYDAAARFHPCVYAKVVRLFNNPEGTFSLSADEIRARYVKRVRETGNEIVDAATIIPARESPAQRSVLDTITVMPLVDKPTTNDYLGAINNVKRAKERVSEMGAKAFRNGAFAHAKELAETALRHEKFEEQLGNGIKFYETHVLPYLMQ